MRKKDKECLPVLKCDVNGDGLLHLDKGAAMRMMQGDPISYARVLAEFTYRPTDNNGKLYYDIPLRLVPRLWVLKLLRKLGFFWRSKWYHKLWDVFTPYQECAEKTVNNMITDFKIGVIKEVEE